MTGRSGRERSWRSAVTAMVCAGAALALSPAPAAAQNVRAGGVDSLHVRGNIQPQLDATTVDDEPAVDWRLRRARLGVRVWAAGWLSGEVEADFGRGRASLTDAYVRLAFAPAARLRMGQFKKPFDALELGSSREGMVIERSGAPRGATAPTPNGLVGDLGYSDRDIGLEWSGAFERVTATAGVWNGSGANTSDEDDGKQVAARVGVKVADGWALAGAVSANRLEMPVTDGGPPAEEWVKAYELALTGGEYAEPGLRALAQVMTGDDWLAGPDATFLALQGVAAWHVAVYDSPVVIGWEPAVRVGWTDPDTDADDDEATILTAGLNVYHHRRVKTQVGVDVLSPAEGDSETALRLHMVFGF